jgi:hypothetical protein
MFMSVEVEERSVKGQIQFSYSFFAQVYWLCIQEYEEELVNLWLYKENNKLRVWKCVFTLHIPPWPPHTYNFVVLISWTHSRKNCFGCAANYPSVKYETPKTYENLYVLLFSVYLSVYVSKALCWTPWAGDESITRPLLAHGRTQTQNKSTQTSMTWVGFELTIQVFERAKTVHALDREVTVIGLMFIYWLKLWTWDLLKRLIGYLFNYATRI